MGGGAKITVIDETSRSVCLKNPRSIRVEDFQRYREIHNERRIVTNAKDCKSLEDSAKKNSALIAFDPGRGDFCPKHREFSFHRRESPRVERYKAKRVEADSKERFERVPRRRGGGEKGKRRRENSLPANVCSLCLNVRLFIGFCVVQRPKQSHQYIREGKGKRVSCDNLQKYFREMRFRAVRVSRKCRESCRETFEMGEAPGRSK